MDKKTHEYLYPTYEKVKSEMERLTTLLELYERLFFCRVPYYMVHHYASPTIASGYPKGEIIRVVCGKKFIEEINNVDVQYPSKKKGYILIDFKTEDNLRRYVNLCKMKNEANISFEQRVNLMRQKKEFEKENIIIDQSYMRDGSMVGITGEEEKEEKEEIQAQEEGFDACV